MDKIMLPSKSLSEIVDVSVSKEQNDDKKEDGLKPVKEDSFKETSCETRESKGTELSKEIVLNKIEAKESEVSQIIKEKDRTIADINKKLRDIQSECLATKDLMSKMNQTFQSKEIVQFITVVIFIGL